MPGVKVNCYIRDAIELALLKVLLLRASRQLHRGVQQKLSNGSSCRKAVGSGWRSPTASRRVPRLDKTARNDDGDLSAVPGSNFGGGEASEKTQRAIGGAFGGARRLEIDLNGFAAIEPAAV